MRADINRTCIETALLWAERSTCTRRKVGCVITDKVGHVLSIGYNGVPKGFKHCTEHECLGSKCASGTGLDACNAIHAEQNAIARLADWTIADKLYCTTKPCTSCLKLILATAVTKIYYIEDYNSDSELFNLIDLEQYNEICV